MRERKIIMIIINDFINSYFMKKVFGSLFLSVAVFLLVGCDSSKKSVNQVATPSFADQTILLLTKTRTTQYFTKEAVPESDVRSIIEAGLNATSGMNMQPWHFSAIIGNDKIQEFASLMSVPSFPQGGPAGPNGPQGMPPMSPSGFPGGPSGAPQGGPAGSPQGMPMPSSQYPKAGFKDAPTAIVISCSPGQDFSTGLACENMFVVAASLGYGVKIVFGGASALNNPSTKSVLGIPEEMNAVAILLIGKEDTDMLSLDGITGPTTRKPFDEVATIVK